MDALEIVNLLNCILEYERDASVCLVFYCVLCTVSDPQERERERLEERLCLLPAPYRTLSRHSRHYKPDVNNPISWTRMVLRMFE